MKIVWGMSGLAHDAAITVMRGNEILFASSTERYSRIKNDKNFNNDIIKDCLTYGKPDKIVWYENPLLKSIRCLLFDKEFVSPFIKNKLNFNNVNFSYCGHHESHLNASLYTAPFDIKNSLGVVIDTAGEFLALSIWSIKDHNNKKIIYRQYYPNSLGLFYSSITKLVGLKPQEEEYILMGMSAYGQSDKYYHYFKNHFFNDNFLIKDLRYGCDGLFSDKEIENNKFDISLGAQMVYQEKVINLIKNFLRKTGHSKVIMSGGCALNCLCNSKILELVNNLWIFPNPGDSGSSLGAALQETKLPVNLKHLYLGHDSKCNPQISNIIQALEKNGIVGVVNGRAEFGPRALGHRSILADPRIKDIKNRVNRIKGREQFRPFAPMILESHFNYFFHNKTTSTYYPFMQYLFQCKDKILYPGITHADGSSRVQTVNKDSEFAFNLLTSWFSKTGCPMLLNTSLNIKGKPLVNSKSDVNEFNNDLVIIT
jgi:carbamoyltransferase